MNPALINLMDGLVNQANGLGMVAIITLQERNQTKQNGPTSSSWVDRRGRSSQASGLESCQRQRLQLAGQRADRPPTTDRGVEELDGS